MYKLELDRLVKGIWRLASPQILIASIIPMMLGAVAAFKETGHFYWYWFFVSVIGVFLIETGKNAVNEVIDYRTGVDRFVSPDKQTPFSGGKKTIVDGILTILEVSVIGFLSMGSAALVGLYVVFFREFSVLFIGLAGFFIAIFYTLPPLKFIYNGLGEIAVGVTYGPLIVMGTYIVQTHYFSLLPFLLSIPVGFLVTNILWINQFPDYEADKKGNKRNWVVRIGKEKSLYVHAALFALTYIYILFLAIGTHKMWMLISLLSIPVAISAVFIAFKHYNDIPKMVGANVKTILVYLLTGVLMAVALLL